MLTSQTQPLSDLDYVIKVMQKICDKVRDMEEIKYETSGNTFVFFPRDIYYRYPSESTLGGSNEYLALQHCIHREYTATSRVACQCPLPGVLRKIKKKMVE